ncbi:MAG: FKBP-type peptidyl-prolyl cis-trans isomerase [bacterium]|nr:FKBP-type peptidyl-prolyl cis-trans isomerase [bacterium]MCP5039865.1 FKBP-type peptidyl-prolyl cis-trans isomerase [bacterium]
MNLGRRDLRAGVALLLSISLVAAGAAFAEASAEKEDDVFYVLGVAVSQGLHAFSLDEAELAVVLRGVKDGVTGAADQINPADHFAKIQELQRERQASVAAEEKARSIEFVSSAAKEKGAKKHDSGLILTTITEGTGASPEPTDTVSVHYHGTLRNGTVFDSSVERDQPATFPLNRVIPCWTEGVGMMKVGGKSRLVCPSEIAYGDGGRPPAIPGGAALVFEVELLDIVSTPQ